jgi:hypothetical protein
MEKCQLKVSSSNYSQVHFTKSKSIKLDGGLSLLRSTKEPKSIIVNVNWITDNCGHGYLIAFYFAVFGLAFQVDLIDSVTGNKTTKICKFVYGSFKSILNGNIFSISANLEILK